MKRWLGAVAVLLALGCWSPRPNPAAEGFRKLLSAEAPEREEGFRILARVAPYMLPQLKAAMGVGASQGFPLVAILYTEGEGEVVPLDLRARHLAVFEWPRKNDELDVIVKPYVRREIERDLVRAGRPALGVLSRTLEQESPTEASAMRIVRVMLWIGGRAAAEEFARLLDVKRDLGGVRVCDAAAAALLYLGERELELRLADPDELVAAARVWWEKARGQTPEAWRRSAVEALAGRVKEEDHEGLRPVFELLAIDDPDPLRPEELLPALCKGRARAYDANRRLERLTGVRLHLPRMERVSGLRAALRLWQPPPDLDLRWKRYLGNPLLRLTLVVVGYDPEKESGGVLWALDRYAHATEGLITGWGRVDDVGEYTIHGETLALGTRLSYGAFLSDNEARRGALREESCRRPVIAVSPRAGVCAVFMVDEVPERRPSRAPAEAGTFLRTRLKEGLAEAEVAWREAALRALGYLQNPEDAELFKAQKAGAPLLLVGDPAGLAFEPRLERREAEMALRKTEDPRVKAYLEGILEPRSGSRR